MKSTDTSSKCAKSKAAKVKTLHAVALVEAARKEVYKAEATLIKVTSGHLSKGLISPETLTQILETGVDPQALSDPALGTNDPALVLPLLKASYWSDDNYQEQATWDEMADFVADMFCDAKCTMEVAAALIDHVVSDFNNESLEHFSFSVNGALSHPKKLLLKRVEEELSKGYFD